MPNGKVEFEHLEQTHISIGNRSENVHTINNAIQMKWDSDFVVVTGDGLEVDDSSGTQGDVHICGIIYSTARVELKRNSRARGLVLASRVMTTRRFAREATDARALALAYREHKLAPAVRLPVAVYWHNTPDSEALHVYPSLHC